MPDISAIYRPRNPHHSAYYRCVEDHFETFEQVYDERFERQCGFFWPYVRKVIYRYLDCGDPHNGFARVKCKDCGHEYLSPVNVGTSAHPWPRTDMLCQLQGIIFWAINQIFTSKRG